MKHLTMQVTIIFSDTQILIYDIALFQNINTSVNFYR